MEIAIEGKVRLKGIGNRRAPCGGSKLIPNARGANGSAKAKSSDRGVKFTIAGNTQSKWSREIKYLSAKSTGNMNAFQGIEPHVEEAERWSDLVEIAPGLVNTFTATIRFDAPDKTFQVMLKMSNVTLKHRKKFAQQANSAPDNGLRRCTATTVRREWRGPCG